MPITIHTKYLGPTLTRGARVKATAPRNTVSRFTVIVPYDHAAFDAHAVAARVLRDRYFPGEQLLLAGATVAGDGDIYTINPVSA